MQNSGKHNNDQLIDQYLAGNRRALSKLITIIENHGNGMHSLWERIHPKIGQAFRIGVTGPPGAGKSTLVDQLSKQFRTHQRTVGVIAVDPTSPFSGGALLGDRIRMSDLATDSGVFIRSMATRGSLGGLSRHAQEVADLYDGFGFDYIVYETVGVGQSELDIVQAADTTIVMLVPEAGDTIQAMKAGLMEIADIFVINKADRPGAERMELEIQASLDLRADSPGWRPPVIQIIASIGDGIDALSEAIDEHRRFQAENNLLEFRRKKRQSAYVQQLIQSHLLARFWQPDMVLRCEQAVQNNDCSPYEISQWLIREFFDENES
ncbi:methylmalonyl Co-A mutase-associated GTPase MeaB [candidate division KSB1 bacterium]|nr:methylmalonyl Co-A mutase-associated GTPase MeaB [candidate division KSB1 bacterium]